jgi:hypothetical protein
VPSTSSSGIPLPLRGRRVSLARAESKPALLASPLTTRETPTLVAPTHSSTCGLGELANSPLRLTMPALSVLLDGQQVNFTRVAKTVRLISGIPLRCLKSARLTSAVC